MSENIGLLEAVSIAVGGMVGGGIFAVLGVVAVAAGPAAWMAFALSGVVALCAGYSFVRLDRVTEERAGPITHIERLTGSTRLAGMTAWVFTFGYVGTMAMYAFAFGGYFAELVGVHHVLGFPARPVLSFLAVALFVGLNVVGAHASGKAEDVLVGLKVLILLVFVGGGLYYGSTRGLIETGFDRFGVSSLTAAAISFVAFEGWELLLFGKGSFEDPEETIRKAIYLSVVGTTLLYVLVAVVTVSLVPVDTIAANPETALAVAARPFLGRAGFVLIAVAAVVSTASALNATLFSAARLTRTMAETATGRNPESEHASGHPRTREWRTEAPGPVAPESDRTTAELDGDGTESGDSAVTASESGDVPLRGLLILGALTAIFTVYGDLSAITSFASGAFITIFGGVSALALHHREGLRSTVLPAVGTGGAAATVVALAWHLHETDPGVLVTVAVIWAVVIAVYWLPRRE